VFSGWGGFGGDGGNSGVLYPPSGTCAAAQDGSRRRSVERVRCVRFQFRSVSSVASHMAPAISIPPALASSDSEHNFYWSTADIPYLAPASVEVIRPLACIRARGLTLQQQRRGPGPARRVGQWALRVWSPAAAWAGPPAARVAVMQGLQCTCPCAPHLPCCLRTTPSRTSPSAACWAGDRMAGCIEVGREGAACPAFTPRRGML